MSVLGEITLTALLGAIVVLLARNLQEMRALRRVMWDVAGLLRLLDTLSPHRDEDA